MLGHKIEKEDLTTVCQLTLKSIFGDAKVTPDMIFHELTKPSFNRIMIDTVLELREPIEEERDKLIIDIKDNVLMGFLNGDDDILFADYDVIQILFPESQLQLMFKEGYSVEEKTAYELARVWYRFWYKMEAINYGFFAADGELDCKEAKVLGWRGDLAVDIHNRVYGKNC